MVTVIESVPYRPPRTAADAWYVPFFGPLGGGVGVGLGALAVGVVVGFVVGLAVGFGAEPTGGVDRWVGLAALVGVGPWVVDGVDVVGDPPATAPPPVTVTAVAASLVALAVCVPSFAPTSSDVPARVPRTKPIDRRTVRLLRLRISGSVGSGSEFERVHVNLVPGYA
jgi:hypothetical protein